MSGTNIRCIFCSKFLLKGTQARQATCGDRLCGACFAERQSGEEIPCPVCNELINVLDSFRDKAVEVEAANVTVKCSSDGCPWEGLVQDIQEHESKCKFGLIRCPNAGCSASLPRQQMPLHIQQCFYQQIPCHLCGIAVVRSSMKAHLDNDCVNRLECPNKCGVSVTRETIEQHRQSECPNHLKTCEVSNCNFKGTSKQLQEHYSTDVRQHISCINQTMKDLRSSASTLLSRSAPSSTSGKLAFESDKALNQTVRDIADKLKALQDDITDRLESSVNNLLETTSELSLTVQTLQATTYNGKFVWKIPEVKRRQAEAKSGKTVSLYSAPFYTSRHGYKICLRLYMNGDGTGKGTHLSFFVTIMRGEYDALLPWPFRQAITLTLVDQNKQRDIVQSFRPESSSSSFQRPRNEMNVASGCPAFAPISVLVNNSYVKDDIMFFKCLVDVTGLESVF